jgi:acetyl-CoA carboxylase biotin carboxyl carrier protein
VEVGSTVEQGTQVCILEVMKLMSAVVAGTRGVIAEISVANGAAVAYGDVLFRIRPA